jgi:hypothetical protein
METKTSYLTAKGLIINAALPEQTRTYKPVSHQQLIDLTLESIESAGFELDSERYSSARDGNVANGRYTIRNVADREMQLEIGWQNSYDKSMSLKFAIGARIMICSNGCVHGDMGSFKKAHKGEIQDFTPRAITEYIKQAGDVFERMQSEREAMKQIEITRKTKAELIGRMIIDEQFIQSTQMNIIERELKNPTHDYGAKNSLWELYNFTTFAMKEIHPTNWMKNHMDAHRFFVNESGILTAPPKEIVVSVEPESPFTQLEMF